MVLTALFVLAQAAAPRAVAAGASLDRPARGECAAVLVSSPQALSRRATSVAVPSFSATHILDLRIASRFRRRLEGEHVLQLKVYTPRGHLYQTLTLPFANREGAPRERWVEGIPRPLPEQSQAPVAEAGGQLFEVTATLPVGGTAIMSNSLYGVWRVEAFLDGDTKTCGPTAQFEIQP